MGKPFSCKEKILSSSLRASTKIRYVAERAKGKPPVSYAGESGFDSHLRLQTKEMD